MPLPSPLLLLGAVGSVSVPWAHIRRTRASDRPYQVIKPTLITHNTTIFHSATRLPYSTALNPRHSTTHPRDILRRHSTTHPHSMTRRQIHIQTPSLTYLT